MIVSIASVGGEAHVVERDDLTRLHVEAALDSAAVDSALRASALGRVEGEDAWLSVSALRVQGASDDPGWPQRFDAMIDYARGKGWCSADGSEVRAHVERA